MSNQALGVLLQRLTDKGLLVRKAFLESQSANGRITAQAGDNLEDGVSVGSYVVRRAQLVLDPDAESGTDVRAEANVEVAVLTQPATNGAVPAEWEGNEYGLVVTYNNAAQASYTTLTPDEVKALPGADQFLMALGSALIAKMTANNQPPPPEVMAIVPNVVGTAQAAAEAAIAAAGLAVGTITPANDAVVVAGNVISQDPAAGAEVPNTSPVNLVVSTGLPPVP